MQHIPILPTSASFYVERDKSLCIPSGTHGMTTRDGLQSTLVLIFVYISDCSAVKDSGKTSNGVYKIKYNHENFMDVFCNLNLTPNSWIVIQRRVDASVDFYRNWASYKSGFGDVTGNFWIGLDNLHKLAGPGRGAILRVDIKHRSSPTSQYYATYSAFEIGDESSKYQFLVTGYFNVITLKYLLSKEAAFQPSSRVKIV